MALRVASRLCRLLHCHGATPAATSGSAPSTSESAAALVWGRRGQLRWLVEDSKGYQHFGSHRTALSVGSPLGRSPRAPWVLGGLLGGFGLYWLSCREEVPYTHRKHAIMFVTERQEKALGKMLFEQQKQEAAMQGALVPRHHPYARLVERVGARVAAVAGDGQGGGKQDHMRNLEWEYAVIQSPVPNAFVVPGGKVVVFTGLLELLGSEEELAAVMAHETGHVLARHHAERMSTLNLISLFKLILYYTIGLYVPDTAAMLGVFLPYSRLAEHEADHIGVMLMARACYSPGEAPSMLHKLHRHEQHQERRMGASMPRFLRTHPLTDDRVERVRGLLPEAFQLYEQSGCASIRTAFGAQAEAMLAALTGGLR